MKTRLAFENFKPDELPYGQLLFPRRKRLASKVRTKITKKTKNKILAIDVALSDIPPNPNMAAIIAMMKNAADQ